MLLPFRKSSDRTADPPRLAGLDVLRGVAILSVFWFHAYIIRPFLGPLWATWVGQGAEGVGLFYLVSALTLALSWQHRVSRDPAPRAMFWTRRFFRIAPLFYLMLLLTGLLTRGDTMFVPSTMAQNPHNLLNLLAHVTFVFGWIPAYQNSWIGVEWSIGVEMTFYLLFPWLMSRIVPKWGVDRLLAVAVLMSVMWPLLLLNIPGHPWPTWASAYLLWSFPTQFVWFGAGLFLYGHIDRKPHSWIWPGLWLAMTVALASHLWIPRVANLLWVVPNVLLLWMVWHEHPLLSWLTKNRVLRYVGQRSYSLYLIHWVVLESLVMRWVAPANLGGMAGFLIRGAVALPISLVLAELSYRYVEQPGIRFGRAWLKRHFPLPEPVTPTPALPVPSRTQAVGR